MSEHSDSVVRMTRRAALIGVEHAARLLDADQAVAIDVEDSLAYRQGHIPKARFAIRSRLPAELACRAVKQRIDRKDPAAHLIRRRHLDQGLPNDG